VADGDLQPKTKKLKKVIIAYLRIMVDILIDVEMLKRYAC
jgi:hypothetical protein